MMPTASFKVHQSPAIIVLLKYWVTAYLINNSVHINCYSKYMQLQELSRQKILYGESQIPQTALEEIVSISGLSLDEVKELQADKN